MVHNGSQKCCDDCRRAYQREYYSRTRERRLELTKQSRDRNPGAAKINKLKWQKENRDAHLASRRRAHAAKYENNIEYRLSMIVRGHLRRTALAMKKGRERKSLNLSYTVADLRKRIEMNMKPGMSWDNYGEWHIDHRVSIAKMVRRGKADMVNVLSNLQPLWAIDNLIKGAR